MSRFTRFFVRIALIGMILAPAFAAAAQEQEQNDFAWPEDLVAEELVGEMAESADLAAENALEEIELALVEPDERHGRHNAKERRAKHERRIGLFQLWHMMNDVELTDEQVDKFFPLWRGVQKLERELSAKRRALVKDLRKELEKEEPDESVLARLTTQILDNSKAIWEARRSGMEKAMDLLTVTQKARFIIAMSQSERRLRESIFRVRSGMPLPPLEDFDSEEFQERMKRFSERLQEKYGKLQELNLDPWLKKAEKTYDREKQKKDEGKK